MAIGAGGSFRRVIKRAGALTGNSAGLPIVVVVETAEPAVIVHRDIQVDLVARRAEFGSVLAHECFHECSAMRFRVEISQKMIEGADVGILAAGDFMKR